MERVLFSPIYPFFTLSFKGNLFFTFNCQIKWWPSNLHANIHFLCGYVSKYTSYGSIDTTTQFVFYGYFHKCYRDRGCPIHLHIVGFKLNFTIKFMLVLCSIIDSTIQAYWARCGKYSRKGYWFHQGQGRSYFGMLLFLMTFFNYLNPIRWFLWKASFWSLKQKWKGMSLIWWRK